ncbi:MAG: AAA family ATPase [Caldilineaceae bacterium]|nr:AAA family ATPase [Caldilineaceae bacterium]
MFPLLHIELLGKFRLSYGDEIIPVASMRLQSFFAFLLLCVEKPQSRRTLAEQFFPNHPHLAAVALLDELIQQAQAILPEAVQPLSVTPELVRWQPDAAYILDVTTFEDMLHQANSTTDPGDACNLLTTALELYTGDLLPACQEDWLRGERDRLRQLYIRALERLTGLLEKQGDYHNAVQHVRRLYHLDSAHAPTYRHLVHLYVLGSGRASDLRTLVERLETTRRNRGALVLISGEAGIGKSSLALVCAEQAHAQGITVAVGHCYERGVTPPFLP